MSNMTLEELASHFTGAKRTGRNSFQCKCPAHDDKKASLTITEEKGKLLLHCHADCKTEEVLAAVGLNFKDISDYQEPDWRKKLEYFYKKKIEAVYDYKTEKGEYLYSKVRFEGKVIRNVTIDYENDTFVSKIDKKKQTLYKLPEVIKAVKTRKPKNTENVQVQISAKKLKQFFPETYSKAQMEEIIFMLLASWAEREGKLTGERK